MHKHARATSARSFSSLSAMPGIRAAGDQTAARTPRDPMRLERRREDREPSAGRIAASYTSGHRCGITQLQIVDRSPSGMGALSHSHIEEGMTVTICPEGSTIPWLRGRAVRSVQDANGMWRVGLVFERRMAA